MKKFQKRVSKNQKFLFFFRNFDDNLNLSELFRNYQITPVAILKLERKMVLVNLQTMLKYFVFIFLFCSFFAFSSELKKTYYEILNVSNTATPDEIRKAYRTQAMKYHPDRMTDQEEANEKMSNINTAYSILQQPEVRAQYDQILQSIQGGRTRDLEIQFYDAFEMAVSDHSNEIKRAVSFSFIDVVSHAIKIELSDQQVHSIVKVVIDINNSTKLVRRLALIALESYIDQLFIEDIELLIILSSSKNRIDDQGIEQRRTVSVSSLMSTIRPRRSGNSTSIISISSNTSLSQSRGQGFQNEFIYEKGIKKELKKLLRIGLK